MLVGKTQEQSRLGRLTEVRSLMNLRFLCSDYAFLSVGVLILSFWIVCGFLECFPNSINTQYCLLLCSAQFCSILSLDKAISTADIGWRCWNWRHYCTDLPELCTCWWWIGTGYSHSSCIFCGNVFEGIRRFLSQLLDKTGLLMSLKSK